jgi:hypothetical protein
MPVAVADPEAARRNNPESGSSDQH